MYFSKHVIFQLILEKKSSYISEVIILF